MKQQLKKYLLLFAAPIGRGASYIKSRTAAILACFFSFCVVFGGIYITASRNMAIKQVRTEMNRAIAHLNEIGLDLAYDNIEFNSVFFFPLVKINNLQIYNIKGLNTWSLNFNQIKAYPNLLGTPRIRFESPDGGKFIFNDFASAMDSSQTFLDISSKKGKFSELVFHADNINIHDFAKIKKIAFLLQAVPSKSLNEAITMPSFETFFEVNDVDINGLINYPLSSHLKLFYVKAGIIGRIKPEEHLLTSMETWLKEGGFIEVPNLIIQWEPLTLVGRGAVNFNEKFSPRVNFNTSSKGILRLIKDLQDNAFLDSKNVFVANILLSNKAFKLNPNDEELTISTPMSYSDGKIAIENLTLKDFTK